MKIKTIDSSTLSQMISFRLQSQSTVDAKYELFRLTQFPILYLEPDSLETRSPFGQASSFELPGGIPPQIVCTCNEFPSANHSILYVTFFQLAIPLRMLALQSKVTETSSPSCTIISGFSMLSLENSFGKSIENRTTPTRSKCICLAKLLIN